MAQKGRKKLPPVKEVQGAYCKKTTKRWLAKYYFKQGAHSPTELAGRILDSYVELQLKGDSHEKEIPIN